MFTIEIFFIYRNRAVGCFVFLNTNLRQIFQLRIQRALVILGNIGDFIKKLRLKADASLYFICGHDNTSLIE